MKSLGTKATIVVLGLLFVPNLARAIAPRYVPDEELAEHPIIVVGHWNKAPVRSHNRVSGNEVLELECHTELVVERVIKGEIKPGTHKVLLEAFIGWPDKDGGPVMSFMSSQREGDIKDVAESNIWFLKPKKSWDKNDTTKYLALTTYRGVQPKALEGYFKAILATKPGVELVKLFRAKDTIVIERTLKYLSGGVLPWPYGVDELEEFQGVKKTGKPMVQYAAQVEELLARPEPEVRTHATAVYAEMFGKIAITRLRQLLLDRDAEVRAVAAGWLVQFEVQDAGDDIVRALVGRADSSVTCQLIDRLRRFKSPHAIPALIEFLQDDGLGLPALKAQKALKELTGYDFPTDVFASRAAWKKVQRIDDAKRRMAELAKMLPYEAEPFAGELVTEGKSSFLVLTNHSTKPVTILREPSDISCTAPGASLGNGGKPPEHRSDFVVIQPGATFRIKVRSAYGQYPRLERMTASFLRNGNEFGVNAWIGVVELKFEKKQ